MNEERQFCTFYLDKYVFGVPVNDVQEVIRYQEVTQVPLAPAVIRGLINLRGQIVTAIDLRRRLGLSPQDPSYLPMNVVLQADDGTVSLLVDRVGDILEVEERDFAPSPDTLHGITRDLLKGVYKLKNNLLLVLDTEKVIDLAGFGS